MKNNEENIVIFTIVNCPGITPYNEKWATLFSFLNEYCKETISFIDNTIDAIYIYRVVFQMVSIQKNFEKFRKIK